MLRDLGNATWALGMFSLFFFFFSFPLRAANWNANIFFIMLCTAVALVMNFTSRRGLASECESAINWICILAHYPHSSRSRVVNLSTFFAKFFYALWPTSASGVHGELKKYKINSLFWNLPHSSFIAANFASHFCSPTKSSFYVMSLIEVETEWKLQETKPKRSKRCGTRLIRAECFTSVLNVMSDWVAKLA